MFLWDVVKRVKDNCPFEFYIYSCPTYASVPYTGTYKNTMKDNSLNALLNEKCIRDHWSDGGRERIRGFDLRRQPKNDEDAILSIECQAKTNTTTNPIDSFTIILQKDMVSFSRRANRTHWVTLTHNRRNTGFSRACYSHSKINNTTSFHKRFLKCQNGFFKFLLIAIW